MLKPTLRQPAGNEGDGSQNYAKWLGIGVEFCGVVGVFCYMGYRLDKALGTSPWLLVSGFFVGFAGMLYIIIRQTWDGRHK
jgi:F0F1-type ATP synthase assembly protein I